MAAGEALCRRMTWMEERMGAAPATPPPEFPPTGSQGPQVVQEMEGPPDDPGLS